MAKDAHRMSIQNNTKDYSEELDKIFPCDCAFTKGFAYKVGDTCDGSCVLASYRERVANLLHKQDIQSRLAEIKSTKENSDVAYLSEDWFADENIKDNSAHEVPLSYFVTHITSLEQELETNS